MRRDPFSRVISLGVGVTSTVATLPSGTMPSVCDRYLQRANGIEIPADFRSSPHDDIEELLLFVELADLRALHQRGCRPPHHARGQSERRRAVRIEPDLDLRHQHLGLHLQIGDARDLRHHAAYRLRLGLESFEVRSIHADHDGRARPCQDFLDALTQVGQQIAVQSRIAIHDRLNLRDRGFVVDGRIEAHPQFGEVRSDDLVGDLGAADVGAEVADAGYRHQLVAGAFGDASHRIDRRARLLHPVHQKVVLTEAREELLTEKRHREARDEQQSRQRPERSLRPVDEGRQHAGDIASSGRRPGAIPCVPDASAAAAARAPE